MKSCRGNKGITLIALAVTIIVLLIISGITISSFTGENGIINKANYSKNITNEVEEREVLETSVAASIGKSKNAKVEERYLKTYLNKNVGEENKDYKIENKDQLFYITFLPTGNEYVISKNGEVLTKDEYANRIEAGIKDNIIIEVGETRIINAIISEVENNYNVKSNTAISWKSDNENIAKVKVDTDDITKASVLGVSNGETVVTAQIANGQKCEFYIIVQTSPSSIELNPNSLVLDISENNSATLGVLYQPSTTNANQKITWEGYDTNKITVSSEGVVQGIENGETTITARTQNGKTANCLVTVQTSPTGISLDQTNVVLDLNSNKIANINASLKPQSVNIKNHIKWSSDRTDIASVNDTGMITGIAVGNATITAETENGYKATCTVEVRKNPTGISLNKTSEILDLSLVKTLQLTATITPNDSDTSKTLTWSSSNQSVATVNSSGLVTGVGKGSTTITVTTVNGKTATCTITVKKSPTEVLLNKNSATLDMSGTKTLQLTSTVNPSDADDKTVTWSSSNQSVATVNSSGLVTGLANGNTIITVSTQNGYTAQCSVVVQTSITSISIEKESGELFVNNTYTLIPIVEPETASEKVYYSSNNTSIATISSTGVITAISPGQVTLNIFSASGKVKLTYLLTVKNVKTFSDSFDASGSVSNDWHTIGTEKTIDDDNIGRKITKIEGSMSVTVKSMLTDKYFGLEIEAYDGTTWEPLWRNYSEKFTWNFWQDRTFSQSISQNIDTQKEYTKIRGRFYISDVSNVSRKTASYNIKIYYE